MARVALSLYLRATAIGFGRSVSGDPAHALADFRWWSAPNPPRCPTIKRKRILRGGESARRQTATENDCWPRGFWAGCAPSRPDATPSTKRAERTQRTVRHSSKSARHHGSSRKTDETKPARGEVL